VHFPVSGVDCPVWVPPLVAFAVSSFTAAVGVSGAFLLLPFQVSVLGFVSPGVSPTNLIFNIVATPGGVYRYGREGRMAWPLAWAVVAGTLPGVFLGAIIRIRYLPDVRSFKVFAGCVLLYLGARLLWQTLSRAGGVPHRPLARGAPGSAVEMKSVSVGRVEYEFLGKPYSFKPGVLLLLGLAVGLIGGIYGIGGGALIAPFLVAVLGLPVYTTAGACLFATWATSIAGVVFFELLGFTSLGTGVAARPDWALGALFGAGGLAGAYAGARLQRFLPERGIRLVLGALVLALALGYIGQFVFV
jgi:uncharacterized membrane protein YfcA